MHRIGNRVGKTIGEQSWTCSRQEPQAAFHLALLFVSVNNIDRRFVVVLVTLLAICDPHIPF